MAEKRKRTEISTLGEFGLIEHLTKGFKSLQKSTMKGVGDDAAVIAVGEKLMVVTTDLLLEGIHFDLTYTPLQHLGYKAVVVNLSDVYAMNATPTQITVSIGVSAKLAVEDLDELYAGIQMACEHYGVDMVGGDTSASLTGLTISITAIGESTKESITYRSGAQVNDLICLSGDLGAALMGLQILEREKQVFQQTGLEQPQLEGYDYVLKRILKPEARVGTIEMLKEAGVKPTSMIDISDGLSSELRHICKESGVGCRVYLEKIPIAAETFKVCEELNFDAVTAALNGGEDYEMLFTIRQEDVEKIHGLSGVDVIGHITGASTGAFLVTPDGRDIELQAQGWVDC